MTKFEAMTIPWKAIQYAKTHQENRFDLDADILINEFPWNVHVFEYRIKVIVTNQISSRNARQGG